MQYSLIDTDIGTMGLGWTERGVARFALPDGDRAQTERRIASGGALRGRADAALVKAIVAYAKGEQIEFADTPLDLGDAPDFNRSMYDDILRIGWGETTTYGDIARRLGDVALSRAVGQALGQNPVPLIIPCHRVLAANGEIGGFSAPGGKATKRRMLALEGVRVGPPEPAQFSFGF